MIALEGVSARRAPLALTSVSLRWEAGAHAIVGAATDGGPLLLAVVAGLARPRSGRVIVLGAAPTDAAVRRQVAFVPLEPALPESMRVREAIALGAAIRREPARDEATRLAVLGVETLADRTVRSLSRAEARAVALAEAITSQVVRVVLVEDPFVALDPRAAGRLTEALRTRTRDGCVVVVTTASLRDAGELTDDLTVLARGAVVAQASSVDALIGGPTSGARPALLTVVLQDAATGPALVAALAREIDIEAVDREAGLVRLRGSDATALARAAGQAAVDAGIDIAELRFDASSGEAP